MFRWIRQLLGPARLGESEWCCAAARAHFASRLDCGVFVVAGDGRGDGRVRFLSGFNAVHRADRLRPVATNAAVSAALAAAGVSNLKVFEFTGVSYCAWCGADLRCHYGSDGGQIRDDEYVAELDRAPEGT